MHYRGDDFEERDDVQYQNLIDVTAVHEQQF